MIFLCDSVKEMEQSPQRNAVFDEVCLTSITEPTVRMLAGSKIVLQLAQPHEFVQGETYSIAFHQHGE